MISELVLHCPLFDIRTISARHGLLLCHVWKTCGTYGAQGNVFIKASQERSRETNVVNELNMSRMIPALINWSIYYYMFYSSFISCFTIIVRQGTPLSRGQPFKAFRTRGRSLNDSANELWYNARRQWTIILGCFYFLNLQGVMISVHTFSPGFVAVSWWPWR